MSQSIATIIKQQLFTQPMKVLSWGPRAWKFAEESYLEGWEIKGRGALIFRVSGANFKGNVVVVLNGMDQYDVYYGSIVKGSFTIKNKSLGCSDFNLVDIIDEVVEKQEHYAY